ncbi:SDR family NAD(P)-dependent oxidoreductase [Acinetobacter sp. A47]|uniref:SDR family NAD(P)-dependent oxidoreductase n=1 Tax=Acinetobacter sp. A47 TaxID=1561217 RepID=UPI00056F375B|nr:SDR family oxidoreductase [Acinetobacter sp. A47]
MLVKNKNAVIFGGSGAVGHAIAHALSREGANVYLGARHPHKLDQVAAEICPAEGQQVKTFLVDVLDEQATTLAMSAMAEHLANIDIVINATSFMHNQGKQLSQLTLHEFMQGITPFLAAQFNIAKAVAPYMGIQHTGAMISMVAPSGAMAIPGHLGHIAGCAGSEAFIKALASELGPRNIRVLGIRSHAIADAVQAGSYTRELFSLKAQAMGLTLNEWLNGAAQGTMLKQLPTLAQIAEIATFLSSDHANAMTGTIINVTAGATIS